MSQPIQLQYLLGDSDELKLDFSKLSNKDKSKVDLKIDKANFKNDNHDDEPDNPDSTTVTVGDHSYDQYTYHAQCRIRPSTANRPQCNNRLAITKRRQK